MSDKLKEVDEAGFKTEVLEATGTVLVDFFATWCGPCKRMVPVLEAFTDETGIKVIKVDVDKCPDLCASHSIKTIPALFVYKDGVLVNGPTGSSTLEKLKTLTQ